MWANIGRGAALDFAGIGRGFEKVCVYTIRAEMCHFDSGGLTMPADRAMLLTTGFVAAATAATFGRHSVGRPELCVERKDYG